MSVDVDGSRPAEVIGEVACHHKGSMFSGHAMVTFDVFILGHLVFDW